MTTYDPRGMEWDQWCSLMAELFAAQQLGTVAEDDWRTWAQAMTNIGYFTQSGVPSDAGFENWQDWAQALVGIMNLEA